MAVELSELEELRDALIRARARGTREVQMGEERVRYGSDAEMAAAIADLERRIRGASTTRAAAVMFSSSKGLG
ncbi:phage head-tail joining protein [Albidovulum sp.]|uniref:phage head-tail joining protein n=1 Tax=Albidovulum sp. TaxID=1872424 RepID=UPI001D821B11|nr:hypothetical protein [Paracoccaceae bacterium]